MMPKRAFLSLLNTTFTNLSYGRELIMKYINYHKMTRAIFEQQPLDSKALLSDVKRDQVIRTLKRSKGGLPRPVQFTNEPVEEEKLAKMPTRDKERLWELYGQIPDDPLAVLPELLNFQAQFPNVPAISNYLSLVYMYSQQEDLYFRSLLETRERFPDYLFGKIGLAEYYLNLQEHTRVPSVLDRKYEIWQHCPDVKVFHFSEVRSFFSVVGSYFARSNKITLALYHYCLLQEIAPDHHATKRVGDEIVRKEFGKIKKRLYPDLPHTHW